MTHFFNYAYIKLSFLSVIGVTFSGYSQETANNSSTEDSVVFNEAGEKIIPFEDRSRRKWDSAVVVDLDQDGYQDLILNEHCQKVRLFWNNGGVFSKPYDIVNGDLHGIAAADYDNDGRVNLVIYQGGGGGSNPRNPVTFQVSKDRKIEKESELNHLEKTRGRTTKLIDCDHNGDLDLLLTGFPTPTQRKLGTNHIHTNNGKGEFEFKSKLPYIHRLSFETLVTDFNNDNISDLIFYGGDKMIISKGDDECGYEDVTETAFIPAIKNTKEASSITEVDFDNDGDFDLFVTRSEHPFKHQSSYDENNKTFSFYSRFKPLELPELQIEGKLIVENLQMAFPHFDVFVGSEKNKITFDVDRHGEKDFELTQKEAKGWPKDVSAYGLYIGYMGNNIWKFYSNTKSPTAAVVHNVISKPTALIPHDDMPAKLLENKNGKFVDVTKKMGIHILEQTTSATSADFNNDGWADLFVVRQGISASQNEQILLLNQQGKGFKRAANHGVISKELGATGGHAEIIDYDSDGDPDIIYSNERGRWHLFTNNSQNNNNYITVKVGKYKGKVQPTGALVTIKAGGNIYKKVVGATSSHSAQGANNHLLFGLGTCNKIDEAKIRWTNGKEKTFTIDKLNTSIFIEEK